MSTFKSVPFMENEYRQSHCKHFSRKPGCSRQTSAGASQVWNIRNDSSNISSLLAPDMDEKSESSTFASTIATKLNQKRTIKSATMASKDMDTVMHCHDCYCRHSPTLPRLDVRPRCVEEVKGKRNGGRKSIRGLHQQKRSHGVKRIEKETTVKSFNLLRDQKFTGEYPKSNLDYTETRSDYEVRSSEYSKIERLKEPEKSQKREQPGALFDNKHMHYRDFKELSDFRKEQYFDCHATINNNACETMPGHKCVHKFIMNDRLLPEPVNCDSYGISRCDICNKPMEAFNSIKRPYSETVKPVKKSVNNVKGIYEYNLMPPRLNISSGKETVQIKVPERIRKECLWQQCPDFKISRKVPGNSYALRYQRGCV